ncbi:hypothetical protein [Nannocystis pusilla]|uniref:hypothetical protein n=1 Tax=Nannocystis pusilla TaxID=889268 RepID=UPI003DA68294
MVVAGPVLVLDASVVVGPVVSPALVEVPVPSSLVPVVASPVLVVAGGAVVGPGMLVMPAVAPALSRPSSPQAASSPSTAPARRQNGIPRVVRECMRAQYAAPEPVTSVARGARDRPARPRAAAPANACGRLYGPLQTTVAERTTARCTVQAYARALRLHTRGRCASKTRPPPRPSTRCWA